VVWQIPPGCRVIAEEVGVHVLQPDSRASGGDARPELLGPLDVEAAQQFCLLGEPADPRVPVCGEAVPPLAGCLPVLLQWPVFSVMYRLFTLRSLGGHANTLLTKTLAGVPLGAHVQGAGPGQLPVFLTLYALLAGLGCLSWRRARRTVDPATPGAAIVPYLSFGTVLFAAIVPLAAGLYLLTTTAWTLAENAHLARRAAPEGQAPQPSTSGAAKTRPAVR